MPTATKWTGSSRGLLVPGYAIETCVFTVPKTVSHERVVEGRVAERYKIRFGEYLERQGFMILDMSEPILAPISIQEFEPPDRRRYRMYARVKRKPITLVYSIDDRLVSAALKVGFKLKD